MEQAPQGSKAFVYSLVLLWIIQKMAFLYLDQAKEGWRIGVMINLFFILAIAAHTLWFRFRKVAPSQTSLIDDFRVGLQRTGLYVMLIGGFILLYYYVIDRDFLENQVQTLLAGERAKLDDYATFEEFARDQKIPHIESETEFLEQTETNIRTVYNPFLSAGGALIGMLMWAAFCAMSVTVLFRKVVFR